MRRKIAPIVFASCFLISLTGCPPDCDTTALRRVRELKREALDLMDLAVEPYPDHAAQAEDLLQRIRGELGANAAKADNESQIELWEMLLAEDTSLFGSFIVRWEAQGKLSQVFIEDAQFIVAENFDQIIRVEEERCK